MTEQEWLECADPRKLLEYLLRKASDRKFRLFAVACCRRVWDLLPDERSRNAVEVAERYADGNANREEVLIALCEAKKVDGFMRRITGIRYQSPKMAASLSLSLNEQQKFLIYVAGNAACLSDVKNMPDEQEQCKQVSMLYCIFGNPFRPVTIHPAWQNSKIVALAQAIYNDRAFDRLPILADALEEAGCDNADILNHCRQTGKHVRGCWVVDLLLGKK